MNVTSFSSVIGFDLKTITTNFPEPHHQNSTLKRKSAAVDGGETEKEKDKDKSARVPRRSESGGVDVTVAMSMSGSPSGSDVEVHMVTQFVIKRRRSVPDSFSDARDDKERDFDCFKRFEMLLNIENIFKEPRGGLSGLTKEILGVGLTKTRRNSNWVDRPLTQNQLEYAALDAAELIHIFWHVRNQSQYANVLNEHTQLEWISHIVQFLEDENYLLESKHKEPKETISSILQPKEGFVKA
ncbi:hypothetical protein L2E82_06505 [Cichorium intybus]|uniref:Uncharacterized protein n=1 Tax=Cichorium intybus TaxID=13427 RepID=A0ACB9HBQ9_CICIN|nr:hypothetical protein L2E82_06505 [Cichorium intybus]